MVSTPHLVLVWYLGQLCKNYSPGWQALLFAVSSTMLAPCPVFCCLQYGILFMHRKSLGMRLVLCYVLATPKPQIKSLTTVWTLSQESLALWSLSYAWPWYEWAASLLPSCSWKLVIIKQWFELAVEHPLSHFCWQWHTQDCSMQLEIFSGQGNTVVTVKLM